MGAKKGGRLVMYLNSEIREFKRISQLPREEWDKEVEKFLIESPLERTEVRTHSAIIKKIRALRGETGIEKVYKKRGRKPGSKMKTVTNEVSPEQKQINEPVARERKNHSAPKEGELLVSKSEIKVPYKYVRVQDGFVIFGL